MRWYETTVKPRIPDITLEELQDAFFTQTLNPYWLSARLIKLCQMAYREGVLLRNFNNRFADAAVNGRFDVHGCSPHHVWLKSLYLAIRTRYWR
jgi:hypothetical protein